MAMKYHQLNGEERSALAALRVQGASLGEIARYLGRHRSTLWRELGRNRSRHDGGYRVHQAQERTRARRRRSRCNQHFGRAELARVEALLREEWSPEQVSGYLRRHGEFLISHETIYRHVWQDRKKGGTLHLHLRGARKQCRKRYGRYDSRGRLAGKRMISERPAVVEDHSWERGTNENTNGLIRQYLPKGQSMTSLTQSQCDAIAQHLNNRPRKRHAYKTPNECFLIH